MDTQRFTILRTNPESVKLSWRDFDSWHLAHELAIELRDLLLREFPVNPVPYDTGEQRKERRERIATACMLGLMACPGVERGLAMARSAVWHADLLIAALDEEA